MPCGNTSVNDTLFDSHSRCVHHVDGQRRRLVARHEKRTELLVQRQAGGLLVQCARDGLAVGGAFSAGYLAGSQCVGPRPGTCGQYVERKIAASAGRQSGAIQPNTCSTRVGRDAGQRAATRGGRVSRVATIRPPARPSSLIDTFVSAPLDWFVHGHGGPHHAARAVLAGWNCLFAVRPAVTVKWHYGWQGWCQRST